MIEALDDPVFDTLDETELRTYGLVVEPNLADLTTFSVGQVCVGDLRASYCGTQKATHDNQGKLVYGGSDLLVARGGFDGWSAWIFRRRYASPSSRRRRSMRRRRTSSTGSSLRGAITMCCAAAMRADAG